jgi:hypothetical protein
MNPNVLEDLMVFVGSIIGMGCTTGIIITMIKHRRSRDLPQRDLQRRLDEVADRLNRIETAVDSTALEVERISEGQRFTTRLLSERSGASALPDKTRSGGSTTPR